MSIIREQLKRVLPASSRTLNGRLDELEKKVKRNSHGDLMYLMCKSNEIQAVHTDTFLPYKKCNVGKEVVIVGTGPTLEHYVPLNGAIHIGVNGAYRKEIDLDYLFIQDYEVQGSSFDIEELKTVSCKKFVGQLVNEFDYKKIYFPEYVADYIDAKLFFWHRYSHLKNNNNINYPIPINIEFYPLMGGWSVIFSALHFALYTHPSKIYIVGCDCSDLYGMYFYNTSAPNKMRVKHMYENWVMMKEYITTFYPDIEVVSINPVGLTGLFEDTYTQEFLDHKAKTENVDSK